MGTPGCCLRPVQSAAGLVSCPAALAITASSLSCFPLSSLLGVGWMVFPRKRSPLIGAAAPTLKTSLSDSLMGPRSLVASGMPHSMIWCCSRGEMMMNTIWLISPPVSSQAWSPLARFHSRPQGRLLVSEAAPLGLFCSFCSCSSRKPP